MTVSAVAAIGQLASTARWAGVARYHAYELDAVQLEPAALLTLRSPTKTPLLVVV